MVLIMRQADTTAPSGDEAFHSCYNLRNLKIPEGVTSLGKNIFGMGE